MVEEKNQEICIITRWNSSLEIYHIKSEIFSEHLGKP